VARFLQKSGPVSGHPPSPASLPARFGADIRTQPVIFKALGRVAQRESTSLTSRGSQVRSLSRPPSSLPKPQISRASQNGPFLWGFSPVSFCSFGLRSDLRSLRPIQASRLRIQKFRSPQWLHKEPRLSETRESWQFLGPNGPLERGPWLSREADTGLNKEKAAGIFALRLAGLTNVLL
jgi:hypothetical protein